MKNKIALIGDGIENSGNALTMMHAAAMFGTRCYFRDRAGLASAMTSETGEPDTGPLPLVTTEVLARQYSPLIALDNFDGASSIYGFSPAQGSCPAVVVGNERKGIARDMQTIATHSVEIPMAARRLNCLNVAAASAVALYYLSRGGGAKMQSSAHPHKRRPELLMLGPADHIELGSAIRSAGAFGWERVFVEDREQVWFDCDRITRSEGRGAARRARNPLHVIPSASNRQAVFAEVTVITTSRRGTPLPRANLARGNQQLIVIPDESQVHLDTEGWQRLGKSINFVSLDLPATEFVYHYRLIATIVLAEIARQVGQRTRPQAGRAQRQGPLYDSALKLLLEEEGQIIDLEDLQGY